MLKISIANAKIGGDRGSPSLARLSALDVCILHTFCARTLQSLRAPSSAIFPHFIFKRPDNNIKYIYTSSYRYYIHPCIHKLMTKYSLTLSMWNPCLFTSVSILHIKNLCIVVCLYKIQHISHITDLNFAWASEISHFSHITNPNFDYPLKYHI